VCRRLKAEADTQSLAVLQVSATHVREEDTVRSLEGGADASLTEPIEPSVLIATVGALLRARRAEEALRDALAGEQSAREAAESANRMKDEFLATLSHELRSPLGAILTWVTMLRSGTVNPQQQMQGLAAIERNTRLQVKLIEDLLDVSRIVSGKMRLDIALVELGLVIEAALESIRPAADAKGVRLEADIRPTLGPIAGDANRLQQVIWNLVSNAVKFTPRGGRVQVLADDVESRARIRVIDTGRGIESAFLPHVYERFRQGDSSLTRSEGGLGLGLAIVRHLVEMHGGTVDAASDGLGQGSVFTVHLPFAAVQADGRLVRPRNAAPRPPSVPLPALAGVHVLVLDDSQDAREAVRAVLEQCGAQVTTVSSVPDALDIVAFGGADVVVSDISMPHQDGFRFIEEVRRLPPDHGGRVPAFALTAHAGADEQRRILAAGFDAYLAKPIEASELAGTVARLLRSTAS
jgi:signal transduction histidine kinase